MSNLTITPEQLKNLRIYDNGGTSMDRYTSVYMNEPVEGKRNTFNACGMSDAPFSPQGVGLHCTAVPGRHLGKRIKFEDLPPDCQKAVYNDVNNLA